MLLSVKLAPGAPNVVVPVCLPASGCVGETVSASTPAVVMLFLSLASCVPANLVVYVLFPEKMHTRKKRGKRKSITQWKKNPKMIN